MQQQDVIDKATTVAAIAKIKREVMAGMLERLTGLAMKKTSREKMRIGIARHLAETKVV